jgi:hypothetical protein
MKEIQNFVLAPLRNDAHFQFLNDVDNLIQDTTPEILGIEQHYPAFKTGLGKEDSALKVERGSSQTKLLAAADAFRDQLDRGFEIQVESYSFHWDPNVAEAARRISRIIGQYGDLRSLPYNEESSALGNKMQELQAPDYAADIELLKLTNWVNQIIKANTEFISLFGDRASEQATRASGNVRAARIEVDPAYQAIVKRINALVVVNGEQAYANFIDKLNYYIDYYKNTIALQRGRKNGDSELPDEPKM